MKKHLFTGLVTLCSSFLFSQSVPNIICKRRGSESSDDKPEKIVPNDVGVASMHEKI